MTDTLTIETPGGQLFAQTWLPNSGAVPANPPIILMHDSLGCVALWRGFPQRISDQTGRRVIAYDRLGFGQSDSRSDRLPPLEFIAGEATGDFLSVVDHLKIDEFIILGHSVGGGMGIGIAAAHPKRCKALITMSAQTFVEAKTFEGVRAAKVIFAEQTQRDRVRKYHGAKADWVLSAWIDTWLLPEFQNWTLDPALRAITCPALAIHGEDDEYGSVAHAQRIAHLAAGPVTLSLLPNEGHFPHRQNEDQVIATIREFLREL